MAKCVSCGKNEAIKGGDLCRKCRDREYGKARYRALKEAGLCIVCGKQPAIQGRIMCGECNARTRKRQKERYTALRAMGRCRACMAKVEGGYAYCSACRAKDAERSKRRRRQWQG
jgi:hypothetical protein